LREKNKMPIHKHDTKKQKKFIEKFRFYRQPIELVKDAETDHTPVVENITLHISQLNPKLEYDWQIPPKYTDDTYERFTARGFTPNEFFHYFIAQRLEYAGRKGKTMERRKVNPSKLTMVVSVNNNRK